VLTRTTVNRYLRYWGLDDERRGRLPPARRFQAERTNDCWQFDMLPSDLKRKRRVTTLRRETAIG